MNNKIKKSVSIVRKNIVAKRNDLQADGQEEDKKSNEILIHAKAFDGKIINGKTPNTFDIGLSGEWRPVKVNTDNLKDEIGWTDPHNLLNLSDEMIK